ncbi:hypothetical protein JOF28_000036 [Leucobacter exalbidus]|uniref:Uncharacterized protein n=1 Tax=Leucobacter exalbidus TaxID=662960 RepID=A0A940PT70_9MICO|nr:hypothetical protein [Leucobacter exalbidus]MBP1324804.1 hypothetical protein [Leucobacter exalbidus]
MSSAQPHLPTLPPPRVPAARPVTPWGRVRSVGAVAAVTVFLGTAALAPFSMADAFALDGPPPQPARKTQFFNAADSSSALLSTSVEGVEIAAAPAKKATGAQAALYSLEEFMFSGVVNWGGYRFTFYSEKVLPGPGLAIPGRHLNPGGYVSDEDGFVVLASDHPKGTVFETPFGYPGKIYDRGTFGNHLDVYIR